MELGQWRVEGGKENNLHVVVMERSCLCSSGEFKERVPLHSGILFPFSIAPGRECILSGSLYHNKKSLSMPYPTSICQKFFPVDLMVPRQIGIYG